MSRGKILFVDDNELNRLVMLDMLEMLFEDYEIVICSSADEVLALDVKQYLMILSDIDMPQISGFTLYNILREERSYNKPIIAVTALAVSGDKEKMLMHGFDDYISKPIDMNELEQLVNKYL